MPSWPVVVLVCAFLGLVPPTPATATDVVPLKISNSSRHVIHAIQVSPSITPQWGRNLLAKGRTLGPGESIILRFRGSCGPNDLRLSGENGLEFLDEKLLFCGDPAETTQLVITVKDRRLVATKEGR